MLQLGGLWIEQLSYTGCCSHHGERDVTHTQNLTLITPTCDELKRRGRGEEKMDEERRNESRRTDKEMTHKKGIEEEEEEGQRRSTSRE